LIARFYIAHWHNMCTYPDRLSAGFGFNSEKKSHFGQLICISGIIWRFLTSAAKYFSVRKDSPI